MRSGFTMVEVLVATTVMSLMIISVLSFVEYGSRIWIKGEQTVTMNITYAGICDLLSNSLLYARAIPHPTLAEGSLTYLDFDAFIASGTTFGTVTYRLNWSATTQTLTKKINSFNAASTLNGNLVPTVASEALGPGKIAKERYEFQVARDVATFVVTRLSDWTVAVQVGLESIPFNATASEGVSLCATNTFLAPGIQ